MTHLDYKRGLYLCGPLFGILWYIYWDNIRRYYYTAWEKIMCNICIYQPETDAFSEIILGNTIALHEKRKFASFAYAY